MKYLTIPSGLVLVAAVAFFSFWRESGDFALREATITSLHKALFYGQTTCHDVVEEYLGRIKKHDDQLRSVLAINPNTKQRVLELDALCKRQKKQLPLFCVPILIKDNIDTYDMPTTSGSKALVNCTPTKDAFIVTKLREAGAIILGKNNLNEFAFQGISRSGLGGQVLNPYDLTRTPGGSSGGTGASIAANFALVGIGSDTMNSIRSPASACDLVGFRPSRGVVSRGGALGMSWTQDQLGPIARTVEDAKTVFEVIAGFYDEEDNVTAVLSLMIALTVACPKSLDGLRLGILTSYVNHTLDDTSHQVSNLFAETCNKLSSQGVELIEFDNVAFHPLNLARAEVQLYEMQDSFTEYLTSPTHPNYPSLDEISTSGMVDEIAVGPTWPLSLLPHMTISSPEYLARLRRISQLKLSLAKTFAELHLDGIIFPHQTILVVKAGATFQPGRNGLLTSLTGTPGVVVPMGFSLVTQEAVRGVPVGMEIIGLWGDDWKVLGIAERIEKLLDARKEPVLFN